MIPAAVSRTPNRGWAMLKGITDIIRAFQIQPLASS